MAQRTLAQLRAALEGLGFGSDVATIQNGWLNDEYKEIAAMRRWKWLEARTTATTVAGTSAYTLSPTPSIRNLDRVLLAAADGTDYRLDWKPTNWLVRKLHEYPLLSDQSAPRYWTYFNGQLLLYPIPDGVYTLQIDYTANISPMVNDSDTPALLPEAYDGILVWGAVARAAFRQNNWLTRDDARGQKQMLINQMEAEYSKEQTQNADEVEWTGFWDRPWL